MKGEAAYVYAIRAQGHQAVKIGFATNPHKRLRDLQIGCPLPLTLLWTFLTDNAPELEAALHRRFRAQRTQGEWFDLGPDGGHIAWSAQQEITTGAAALPMKIDGEEYDAPIPLTQTELSFLPDIQPWVAALPAWARHVTVEHLMERLRATRKPRWREIEAVDVGRMLDRLFGEALRTPARSYADGYMRVAVIRKAAQQGLPP